MPKKTYKPEEIVAKLPTDSSSAEKAEVAAAVRFVCLRISR